MIKIQQQSFDNVLGSIYVSDPFQLDITVATTVTISNGILNVNGLDIQNTSSLVYPTDEIVIKITNARVYNTTTYATLSYGTNNYVVSATTSSSKIHSINTYGLGPFEFVNDPTRCTQTAPTSDNNKISVLFQSGDKLSIDASSVSNSVTYPSILTLDMMFISNYYNMQYMLLK